MFKGINMIWATLILLAFCAFIGYSGFSNKTIFGFATAIGAAALVIGFVLNLSL